MDPRTHERVERWESRPFSGGYDGLSDLADAEFSGAVTAGGAWAFMLNGRIVGVFDGSLEAFESNQGTIYDSPHPSLPLLCTMHEGDSETRAKYYTNDTPIHEVDRTLQNKSFTGYVELSEQVLSGDYYLVYYGGRRMAAAYIGNAERLLTGEEAFERADDEVGIYRVVDTSIEIADIPSDEPEPEPAASIDEGSAEEPGVDERGADTDLESTDTAPVADATSQVDPREERTDASENGITTTASPVEDVTPSNGITDAKSITDEQEGDTDSAVRDGTDEATAVDSSDEATTAADDDQSPQPMPPASDEDTGSVITEAEADATTPEPEDATTPEPEDATTSETEVQGEQEPPAGDTGRAAQPMPPASSDGLEPDEVEQAANELDDDALPWNQDPEPDSQSAEIDETAPQGTKPETSQSTSADPLEERFKREEQWRETRQIPSIDPDNSKDAPSSKRTRTGRSSARSDKRPRRRSNSEKTTDSNSSDTQSSETARTSSSTSTPKSSRSRRQQSSTQSSRTPPGRSAEDALEPDMLEREDRIDQLTQKVDELEAEKSALENRSEELESERDTLAAERAELQGELESLREERSELSTTIDSLRSRIDELENELERVREQRAAGIPVDATELTPNDALRGTNLFVRYDSKSQPTLKSAHDDGADRDAVVENLRLEHHTQFDSENVVVNGQPYDEFLHSSMEFQLVRWLIETLPFEVRDTGHGDALGDLYDAIPFVDRAELYATISLEDDETEGVPDTVEFDVVVFDKMGNPLIAINLNDAREPATRGMLETMEASASAVKANHPELSAAFVVTSSFFEPGALEVVEQATGGGGFLSRDSRMSYVSLSRKQGGYHLCLAESRSGGFHMNVPEL